MSGKHQNLIEHALLKALVVYPCLTLEVVAANHREALRLWRKARPAPAAAEWRKTGSDLSRCRHGTANADANRLGGGEMSVTGLSPAAMRMMIGSARLSREIYDIKQNFRPSRTGRSLPRKVWPLKRPNAAHRLTADESSRLILSIAASSDKAAFERLFEHFAPRVKAYLLQMGADDGLSEDISQETMLTVWRKAAYFDPTRAGASTWIYTIARNLRIDQARGDKRGVAMPFDPSQEPEGPLTAETLMTVAQRDDRVRDVLMLLPREQAEIVKLSFFNDEPHSAIARTLEIPLGTVKSRVRLAMSRLRAALEGIEP